MVSMDSVTREFKELRYKIGATAAAIATTEDWIAGTLERMAKDRPREARRLRARAAEARRIAVRERERAIAYGWDPPVTGPGSTDVSAREGLKPS